MLKYQLIFHDVKYIFNRNIFKHLRPNANDFVKSYELDNKDL